MSRILIVDDDQALARTLELHLRTQGHTTRTAHSVDQGLALLGAFEPGILILDIRMPGKSGLDGLSEFKSRLPKVHVIMITAFHDMDSTISAMQAGAEDYLHKPLDIDELDAVIARIDARASSDSHALAANAESVPGAASMVGHSHVMKEVFKTIGLVAKGPATVLISGESGTGKELVAQAIHRCGARPDGPFVVVNCAAVVDTLLESDMFGHRKGAFTGAMNHQAGKFALARGGTIFLDEVGEMSAAMQAKLLRILQYKEFFPLGEKEAQTTDARIVAATNEDLAAKVARGEFREDLLYRLQVVNIHVPPLRDRMEDLMELVQVLLNRINHDLKRSVSHVTCQAMQALQAYHWPGNVRELENALMKAVAVTQGNTLTLDLLDGSVQAAAGSVDESSKKTCSGLLISLAEMERRHIIEVLRAVRGHKGRACEILGISRPRLRRMMREYGLETETNGS